MHTYEEFLKVIEELRSEHGCPWDREQTHASLKQCMLEEAYEVIDGITEYEKTGDYKNLREELGDVLLQVVLHAQIAKEESHFSMEEIVDEICEKMIRRHPHVFGDAAANNSKESLVLWEDIKKQEKKEETLADTLNRVAKAFPANIRAEKIQKKAAKSGFEFESLEQVLGKVKEELAELEAEIFAEKCAENPQKDRLEEEFGDLPIVYSGGVMANNYIKEAIKSVTKADFASLELSGDNAVGIALLAKLCLEKQFMHPINLGGSYLQVSTSH